MYLSSKKFIKDIKLLFKCYDILSLNMDINKIPYYAYYASTFLLTIFMLFSAGMSIFNNAGVVEEFTQLGYPTYIIYPLAIAKILGLIAIWSNYSRTLKEWAYAGFLYDFTLALSAHINAGDGELAGPIIALALLAASYFSYRSYFS